MAGTMKVMWVFPTLGAGAPLRRFGALAAGLPQDVDHLVLALDGDTSGLTDAPSLPEWRAVSLPGGAARGPLSLGALWGVRRVLADEMPDLIVSHGGETLDWPMINRGPGAAAHIHIEDAEGASGDAPEMRSRDWARRRALPGRRRLFIAGTEGLMSRFQKNWAAPAEQVRRLPLGAASARYETPAAETAPGGEVRFGALPTETTEGVDRLLRLIGALRGRGRNVRALIGGARDRRSVRSLAKSVGCGDAVDLTPDADALFAQSDVLCRFDGDAGETGLADAMAAARPVLALASGDKVAPANGPFARLGADDSALAAAGELLAIDGDLRTSLGAANRALAADVYAPERLGETFGGWVRSVLGVTPTLMLPSPDRARPLDEADLAQLSRQAPSAESLIAARAHAVAAARARAAGDRSVAI